MKTGLLGQIVTTFGVLSLVSIGGANALVPEIHRQIVDLHGWMDDGTFASLVAIGQTAPGPNVLIVSMIGWHLAGAAGLLAATLAILLPSCLLAAAVGRLVARFSTAKWVGVTKRVLAPIAVGFMIASGYVMSRASYEGPLSLAIVGGVAAMIVLSRRSPLIGIAAGAMIGILGHRLSTLG